MIGAEHPLTREEVNAFMGDALLDRIYPGKPLIVSFSGFGASLEALPHFEFFNTLSDLDRRHETHFNKLFLRDAELSWYHLGVKGFSTDIPSTIEALRGVIAVCKAPYVLFLGNSMGGTAAMLFGAALGIDRTIAFGPRGFLDRERVLKHADLRLGWRLDHYAELPPELPRVEDISLWCREHANGTRHEIYYGTLGADLETGHLDALNAIWLKDVPNAHLFPSPETGHSIARYLGEQGRFPHLLPVQGHLDGLTAEMVYGWACPVDPLAPACELDILLNGKSVAHNYPADYHRADLERAGKRDGKCGFRFSFKKPLKAGDEVEVRYARYGYAMAKKTLA